MYRVINSTVNRSLMWPTRTLREVVTEVGERHPGPQFSDALVGHLAVLHEIRIPLKIDRGTVRRVES